MHTAARFQPQRMGDQRDRQPTVWCVTASMHRGSGSTLLLACLDDACSNELLDLGAHARILPTRTRFTTLGLISGEPQ
mgnify:FL=1|jgi:hypothetical protein